jgi:hypothetical protein
MAETAVPDLAAAPAKVGRDRHRGLELLRATEAAALTRRAHVTRASG